MDVPSEVGAEKENKFGIRCPGALAEERDPYDGGHALLWYGNWVDGLSNV